MVVVVRTPAELTEAFRERGMRNTPQRQLIFRILPGNEAHPTAEAAYAVAAAEMPSISLRTVYQTLNDLAEMGELNILDLGTGAARFDPNVDDHHHLVCERCGTVRDVYLERPDIPTVAPDAFEGFTIASVEVTFRGRCSSCSSN
jgi:Fe2+ or Zn2+ uptake regulation protein